jgi:quinol monooxygenase YgiN
MSPKPVTVTAVFEARPGKVAELKHVLSGLLGPTRNETGCLNYDLHVSRQFPGKFLFHENWESQAALDAHLQSPHVKALLPRVGELCSEAPQILIWQRMDSGDGAELWPPR